MKESLLIIPQDVIERLEQKQDKIISLLESEGNKNQSEYITEAEARELFKRKATWFWQMRKGGVLPYSKIGKAIYYSRKDLNDLLNESKSNIK